MNMWYQIKTHYCSSNYIVLIYSRLEKIMYHLLKDACKVQHEKLTTDLPFFLNHRSRVCCRGWSITTPIK